MVGGGPRIGYLKTLAGNLGISKKVIFLGPISHDSVLSMMRTCSVVVNPARHPWACKVTLEAFANGNPVVKADAFDTYPISRAS
jgi:glycogen(starch) synthase